MVYEAACWYFTGDEILELLGRQAHQALLSTPGAYTFWTLVDVHGTPT